MRSRGWQRSRYTRLDPRRSERNQYVHFTRAVASSEEGTHRSAAAVHDVELHEEASQSYLSYALSVIIGRALPDVRDGLKPVHRRTLFAMSELGLGAEKPYRKCARVVGEVLGKLHPHGDNAVYQSLVRMAQPFSVREPLIEGHGNFGSLDNDPPAAMRYTECRLMPMTEELLLSDLSNASVPWQENFDGSMYEPSVLPTRLPNLLLNGAQGIAVGMATQVPSHNLAELADAVSLVARDPGASLTDVLKVMPGPDLPTGGILLDKREIKSLYAEGQGSLTIRAKMHVETVGQRQALVVTEIPYSTNKSGIVERIADLISKKTVPGIADIRDESDREGLRLVIEAKRNADIGEIHSSLLKHTRLELKMSCNMVVLNGREPVRMTLLEQLHEFTRFRREVIRNKASEKLSAAQKRAHVVDGLITALQNSNAVISTIRNADSNKDASSALEVSFGLSHEQAEAILGMSLRRLTGQESDKLQKEHNDLSEKIVQLRELLNNDAKVAEQLQAEAEDLKEQYGNARRTKLLSQKEREELERNQSAALHGFAIPDRVLLLALSKFGHMKRMDTSQFRASARGAKGVIAARYSEMENSFVLMLPCKDQDSVIVFTQQGYCSALTSRHVPESSRISAGENFSDLLLASSTDTVASCLNIAEKREVDRQYALLISTSGILLRLRMAQVIPSPSQNPLQAMKMKPKDTLCRTRCVSEDHRKTGSLVVVSSTGKALRFGASDVQVRNRPAQGVTAMKLQGQDKVADMAVVDGFAEEILLLSKQGRCIRFKLNQLPLRSRKTTGLNAMDLPSGDFVARAETIGPEDAHKEVLISTANGMAARSPLAQIGVVKNRGGKGVVAMNVQRGDSVVDVRFVDPEDDAESEHASEQTLAAEEPALESV